MTTTDTRKLSSDRETRELIKEFEEYGWEVETTNGGHLRFTHPDVDKPVFASKSPSDHRSVENTRAALTREIAYSVAKRRPEVLDAYVEENPDETYRCPACLGNGVDRVFMHPVGLVNHMESEHPAEPFQDEPQDDPQESVPQETAHEEKTVSAPKTNEEQITRKELEEAVVELYEDGALVTLDELRGLFPDRKVENAVAGLKRRKTSYPKLEQMGGYRSKTYRVVHAHAYTEVEWEPEAPVSTNGHKKTGRLFEELGYDLEGNPLVRDADGNLWVMELKPL